VEQESLARTNPPLVLLHGLGTGPSGWTPQVEALSTTREVFAPRLIGPAPFSFETAAGSLDELPVDRFDLCGLSLGALVGLRFAGERPDRVRRLVVCACFARLPWHLRQLQRLLAGAARVLPASRLRRSLVSSVPGSHRQGALEEVSSLTPSELSRVMRAGASFRLTRLPTVPTLVLCGERDRVNRRLSRRLADALPNAELAVVPDAGHVANLDNAEAFTALMRDFLDD
jgi:3-oxoadipate enol-lactonase